MDALDARPQPSTAGFIAAWTGPGLTVWDPAHVFVADGCLQLIASRAPGSRSIRLGCVTSRQRVRYPLYVDGRLVRTVAGEKMIDPHGFTGGAGLSKEMDIIINVEDQAWRSERGLTPTDSELQRADDHTFRVDWIRVYELVDDR